jgi:hypothetical protein
VAIRPIRTLLVPLLEFDVTAEPLVVVFDSDHYKPLLCSAERWSIEVLEQIVSGLLESELRAVEQSERAVEQAERTAERSQSRAKSAADGLRAICDVINAAPTRVRSTSSSRSPAPDLGSLPSVLATQQTDEDDDGAVPTDDQRAAAAAAARAALSRAGGTEFRDFIDTWSMPEADADRLAVADDILRGFEAMLAKPIGGSWQSQDAETVAMRLAQLVHGRYREH